jgi:hypothetical protein
MKFLIFVSLFLCHLAVAADEPKLRILSDVDDTIRITHTGSAGAIGRVIVNRDFVGMASLYRALAAHEKMENPQAIFVSGSPSILRTNIAAFLSTNGFPPYELYLRSTRLPLEEIYSYKIGVVNQVLARDSDVLYLAFGDDTERDQEVYRDIAASNADRILATYIHKVKGRADLAGQNPYYTAVDIALKERAAGRLSLEQLRELIIEVMSSQDYERIIPEFAVCPEKDWLARISVELPIEDQEQVLGYVFAFEKRVLDFCQARELWQAELKQMHDCRRDRDPECYGD